MYRDETKNLVEMGDFCPKDRVPVYTMNLFAIGDSMDDITVTVVNTINPSGNEMRFNSMAVITNEKSSRSSFNIVNDTPFKITLMMYYTTDENWVYQPQTTSTVTKNIGVGETVFLIAIASVS